MSAGQRCMQPQTEAVLVRLLCIQAIVAEWEKLILRLEERTSVLEHRCLTNERALRDGTPTREPVLSTVGDVQSVVSASAGRSVYLKSVTVACLLGGLIVTFGVHPVFCQCQRQRTAPRTATEPLHFNLASPLPRSKLRIHHTDRWSPNQGKKTIRPTL